MDHQYQEDCNCLRCNKMRRLADEAETLRHIKEEEKLDRLVQVASRPKLADLYRAGLKSGLLKAVKNYH